MENSKQTPITLGSQEGQSISVIGDTYRVLISGKQTGNAFATIDMLFRQTEAPGRLRMLIFRKAFLYQKEKWK